MSDKLLLNDKSEQNTLVFCSERDYISQWTNNKLFAVKCKHSLVVIVYVANITNDKWWLNNDELLFKL